MANKVKVDKEWIQESADQLYESGLNSSDKNLISKCVDSDQQVSEASMIMYWEDWEREDIRKSAAMEMDEILKFREESLKNIVKMDGETPEKRDVRWWNLHPEIEERYSLLYNIIN